MFFGAGQFNKTGEIFSIGTYAPFWEVAITSIGMSYERTHTTPLHLKHKYSAMVRRPRVMEIDSKQMKITSYLAPANATKEDNLDVSERLYVPLSHC